MILYTKLAFWEKDRLVLSFMNLCYHRNTMIDVQSNLEKLNKIFENNGVILAYIFGSAAKGKEGALSDLDIAIFFRSDISANEQFQKELDLAGEIGRLMEFERVDVINLNRIDNPLLLYNIILEGRAIFVKDQHLKTAFERRTLREYEDTAYLRAVSSKIMRRQIKEGSFGAIKT